MSPTTLCNLALGRLGEASIMDMDEGSTAARACKLHFPMVRDSMLRSFPWNFARRRVALSQLMPAPLYGYGRRYQLPSDSLRILEVNGSDYDTLGNNWRIEGQELLTDADTVEIAYVAKCEDVNLWDSLFQEAFTVKLAHRLSQTIRGGSSADEALAAEYERLTKPLAQTVDANEDKPRRPMLPWNSRFVNARGGGWNNNPEISGYGLD